MTNEAFSRVKTDAQLRDQDRQIENPDAMRFEYVLDDGTRADYVLCDRHSRSIAVIEANRFSANPGDTNEQAIRSPAAHSRCRRQQQASNGPLRWAAAP